MRYHRGCPDSAIVAAQQAAAKQGRTLYVFATALGMTIQPSKPPFSNISYAEVGSDRKVSMHVPDFGDRGAL